MRIAIIFLLTAVVATAQTSSTLRQKYGQPTSETYKGPPTSQTYNVRPDIKVTVSYTKHGNVCAMLIKPVSEMTNGKPSVLKTQQLNEVIDELVPKEQRGKHQMDWFLHTQCYPKNDCFGVEKNYQRLTIHVHGSTDKHPYASIRWKKHTCARAA